MTLNEILNNQFAIEQSRTDLPETKADIQSRMSKWAEKSRSCGIVPRTPFFHRGK